MGVAESLALLVPAACALPLGVVALRQQRRIRDLRSRLESSSRNDSLTGLLGRRAFEELLALELERARRSERALSVIVGDLDGFVAMNVEHGHEAGDVALRLVARDIEKWKRRIDQAARIGGEEFALLLPDTDERGAFLVAERLRRSVARTFAAGSVPLTFSFGVASHPAHGEEPAGLLLAAGRAVAAAKDMGRDRTVIYSSEVARMLAAGGGEAAGDLQLATVIALAEALDIRDTGTARHSHAVGRYAELMAIELGLEPDHVERVRLAGILHDVGKIGISDGVLAKPGPLDAEEWREMRTHPEIAARLLSRTEFDDLRAWILAHHERPDGEGYPNGLGDAEIPLEARILAVADAYESMTADRVYRPALGERAARAELEAGSGSQFDGDVVTALVTALAREGAVSFLPAAS